MALFVVGLNHRTADLALREQLAVSACGLAEALRLLRAGPAVTEAAILSTCNRLEHYVVAEDCAAAQRHVIDMLAFRSRLAPQRFLRSLYGYRDQDAAAHMFRVAAGLDSMILGESEIIAQVKQAYLTAYAQGTTGPVLNRLFQKALHSAKIVRSRTRIAEGEASVGSVVSTIARQCFGGSLAGRQALLWGAGKAAATTARHLLKHGVQDLWIVNRTAAKAQELAALCRGGWLSWHAALPRLASCDLAVICTQAPHYVVEAADVAAFMPARQGRPLVLIDLAVPRNIEPSVAHQPGVRLYDLDRIQSMMQATLAQRAQAMAQCRTLIKEQVAHFARWQTRGEDHSTIEEAARPCGMLSGV